MEVLAYRLYRLQRPTNLSSTDLTTFALSPLSVPLRGTSCKASSLTKVFLSSVKQLCAIYIHSFFWPVFFLRQRKNVKIKRQGVGVWWQWFHYSTNVSLGTTERGSTSRHQTHFLKKTIFENILSNTIHVPAVVKSKWTSSLPLFQHFCVGVKPILFLPRMTTIWGYYQKDKWWEYLCWSKYTNRLKDIVNKSIVKVVTTQY